MSALNVLLGRHFSFREGDYAVSPMSEPRFFTRMTEDLEPDIEDEEEEEEEEQEQEEREREKVHTGWTWVGLTKMWAVPPG